MPKVAIVGTTTWGTALGIVLAGKGVRVKLWARTSEESEELNHARQNHTLLPGREFPPYLSATSSVSEALDGADMVILAVPAQSMRGNMRAIGDYLERSMLILSVAKGLETSTTMRMSQVIAEELPPLLHHNICVLSGPNLAKEIVQGLPAETVVAAADIAVAERARELIAAPNLCVFTDTDVIGVELGGALKNIIAIGAGIIEGLGYGDNAKAAYIVRGLAEITALGVAAGANPVTFSGRAGLGDLVVTCLSALSRNHYVGVELAKGRSLPQITASMNNVAEGIYTAMAARRMARRLGVETPIVEVVYRALFEGLDSGEAAGELIGLPEPEALKDR